MTPFVNAHLYGLKGQLDIHICPEKIHMTVETVFSTSSHQRSLSVIASPVPYASRF